MNRAFKYCIYILILIIISYGCSTKKNTGLTRFYHGLTTKYNILFNGTESYKSGVKKYNESYKDDYSQVLPIFKYGDEDLASSTKPQMDRTIEKATKSIRLHSITKKPEKSKDVMSEKDKAFYSKKEFNVYIDDSYLAMGKAFFYQADYASAIRIFDFIIIQYDEIKTKYLAQNWLVRSYVQKKDFREAQNILDFLVSDIDYPEKLNYQLNLTLADFYLKQQKFSNAEPYVSEALRQVRKRSEKRRLTFIHAQLKEELGKARESSELYKAVIKMNPDYEMAFNAKIKRATLFEGGKFSKSIKAELMEMLKDDKNTEYQDQIYYALGNLEMKTNNVSQAIEYYKKSTKVSMANTNQKAISFLALANLFFDRTDYTDSQAYFDSAVTALDPSFPGYAELSRKNKYLSKLVRNLNEVELQDSVQMIAALTENQRNQFIQKIINDLRVKEQAEKERIRAEQESNMNNLNITSTRQASSLTQGGKWYFYNPSAKGFGQPEFKRRWGERKLEDNWRRKNKQIGGIEVISDTEISDEIVNRKEGLDNKTVEYYMVDLPLTDSAMQASHLKIQLALFTIGEVYRNDLKDYPLAIEAYKDLIKRYPESEFKVPAYYSLYKVYLQEGNQDQAETFKNMIIRNYPESQYAKVLVNPDYFKQFEKEEKELRANYTKTLSLYNQGNFTEVLNQSNKAIENENNIYTPKYRYLRAVVMGEIYGISVLKSELEKIKNEFKNDPVAGTSEELLALIKKNEINNISNINIAKKTDTIASVDKKTSEIAQLTIEEIEKLYKYESDVKHNLAIIISKEADINQLKFNVINFNLDYYIQESYDLESNEFNEYFTILTIKQFKNPNEGLKYFNKFSEEEERIFTDVKSTNYQFFVISDSNLINLSKEKMVRDYLVFYNKYYRKQE